MVALYRIQLGNVLTRLSIDLVYGSLQYAHKALESLPPILVLVHDGHAEMVELFEDF